MSETVLRIVSIIVSAIGTIVRIVDIIIRYKNKNGHQKSNRPDQD